VTVSERPEAVQGSADERQGDESGEAFPRIDFVTFVMSLVHSVYLHLGDAPNPLTGRIERNLTMAQQTIDLLGLLEQKTQGNLTGEEERVLEQVLYELRLRFVEATHSSG
jgi:hypothetical protein